MRQPLTIDQARVIEANGAGTTFLEAAAVEVQALLDQGTASLRDSEAAMDSAFVVTLGAALGGALVTAVFALAAWLALGRSIGLPVAGLTALASRRRRRRSPPRWSSRPRPPTTSPAPSTMPRDRKSTVKAQSVYDCVDIGGGVHFNKKKT